MCGTASLFLSELYVQLLLTGATLCGKVEVLWQETMDVLYKVS